MTMLYRAGLAVVVAATVVGASHAATFVDSVSFNAATRSLTTEDYSSYAPGTLIADGGTLGALTYHFSTSSNLGGVITNVYNSVSGSSLGAKQVVGPLDPADFFYGAESFTVTFPTAVRAVGVFVNVNLPFAADLTTAPVFAIGNYTTYDTQTFIFIGLTSATPFTSATFTGDSGYNVTSILYGDVVPEPALWAMMVVGFGLVGSMVRRNRPALA